MVRTAVILAAGSGTRLGDYGLEKPKGFLRLGKQPIIQESIGRLKKAGIERVVIATGHCREAYDELAQHNAGFIHTVFNQAYRNSGSMYSLHCVKELVKDDFILLESDLIFEQRAIDIVLDYPQDSCVLMSGMTNAGDEVYVESRNGRLAAMSKDPTQLEEISGELVGISKISSALFDRMLGIAENAFRTSLHYDYETDCLVAAAKQCPVYCCLVEDLVWGEIDDHAHLERARSVVYPALMMRDTTVP